MPRTERQGHGFDFETYIIQKYNIIPSTNYTAKWDGFLDGIPVSIKTKSIGGDIELADFKRNAENEETFYLIVGFWEGNTTNIVAIETLLIDGQEWHALFPQHFIQDFENMLNSITNDRSDDAKWRELMNEQKRRWQNETNNLIRPRFKRDHRSQKRVQCAINYNDFYDYFIPKYQKEI